ncbi:DUF397 domain-containing protein [Streptomyces sp. NPDC052496]|uniref:DUF397 domain-containing protein n=1 Tax=Streptomyces sp. NPDC052496 TaxID=3154951 RepID=UPI003430B601
MNPSDITWRKSTYSGGQDECLEIADGLPTGSPVSVRDSKRPDGPHLRFSTLAWASFTDFVSARTAGEVPARPGQI